VVSCARLEALHSYAENHLAIAWVQPDLILVIALTYFFHTIAVFGETLLPEFFAKIIEALGRGLRRYGTRTKRSDPVAASNSESDSELPKTR